MCPLTSFKKFCDTQYSINGNVKREKAKGRREHVDYINLYVDYEKRKN